MSYSTLTWVTTTNKDTTIKTSKYSTYTNEAGYENVTEDTEAYTRNDTPAPQPTKREESKETQFTGGGDMDANFAIGATWFMNDKVQMDVAYSGVFNDLAIMNTGGIDGLLAHELKIMFTVKF